MTPQEEGGTSISLAPEAAMIVCRLGKQLLQQALLQIVLTDWSRGQYSPADCFIPADTVFFHRKRPEYVDIFFGRRH